MQRSIASLLAALVMGSLVLGITSASAGPTRTYSTSLTGAEEAPGPGDPNATGSATVTLSAPNERQICVSLSWAGVSGEDANSTNDPVVASHIHKGDFGEPGPVVFTIFANQSLPTTDSTSMCASATPKLITGIQNHPEDYYVNVHSGEYPGGAVRGQLGD